jgi:hypothetical protein
LFLRFEDKPKVFYNNNLLKARGKTGKKYKYSLYSAEENDEENITCAKRCPYIAVLAQ